MPMAEPLWQVMRDAYERSSGTIAVLREEVLPGPGQSEFAAMIRAITKAIEVQFDMPYGDNEVLRVIDWLEAEADRAEAGE
jgi:hypothetical protein